MPPDRPASRPALPVAVSTLVAGLVHGGPVEATVVGAHGFALYLSVRGSVLPVVTSDAVALPTAVRLAVASGTLPLGWGVASGERVLVGAGRVVLPGVDLVAARTWRPARVRPVDRLGAGCSAGRQGSHVSTQLELSGRGASATAHENRWLAEGIRAVVSRLGCPAGCSGSHVSTQLQAPSRGECGNGCRGDHFRTHDGMGAAVAALVGRGAGLTPSGDDALAGALLVAHALGTGTALADAVRGRLGATTAVSAALLDAAADGYAARPVVTLVDAAVAGGSDAVRRALPAVLALGHTSGADTVTGIRAALDSLDSGVGCSDGGQGSHLSTQLDETTGGRAA